MAGHLFHVEPAAAGPEILGSGKVLQADPSPAGGKPGGNLGRYIDRKRNIQTLSPVVESPFGPSFGCELMIRYRNRKIIVRFQPLFYVFFRQIGKTAIVSGNIYFYAGLG